MGPHSANDLDFENITQHSIDTNSQGSNPRLNYVLERLVSHLHAFARETRLSNEEWMAGVNFLTEVGQTCTNVRQACSLFDDYATISCQQRW